MEKVEAIRDAPVPRNTQELKSFLGILHYYDKFMPNLSSLLHPLNQLLRSEIPWEWSPACNQAFASAKNLLISAPVLAHYDPTLPLKLDGDASAYGIGAVISHVLEDGSEQPIAYASRTLSSAERNYAQVEKEALSLVFGVRKFHQYLYGRKFVMVTDHKPLLALLGPKKGIPPLAAARLQRWAILLSGYTYELEFRSTEKHSNADCLSRLPLETSAPDDSPKEVMAFNIGQIEALPITDQQLE